VSCHAGLAAIRCHDIGDYLSREQTLALVDDAMLKNLDWETIAPNEEGDWISQRDPRFDGWQVIGGEDAPDGIFTLRTGGLKTNRDAWVYDHSHHTLDQRVARMVGTDNRHADRAAIMRGTHYHFDRMRIFPATYNPFDRQYVCFDYQLNDMVDMLPDVACYTYTIQFFPRWTWQSAEDVDDSGQSAFDLTGDTGDDPDVVDGYRRVDNITDAALVDDQTRYGSDVTTDDIFFSVYGLLHSSDYRTQFATDLKKRLPRIPRVASTDGFQAFVDAGRELGDLHVHHEDADLYPLTITGDIPQEAQEYLLGSRSGLDWILERYQVKTDKPSGIVNDPNDWSREVGNPRSLLDLIQRVTTVSVRTVQIVRSLPPLVVED